jgi:hypothetical protein
VLARLAAGIAIGALLASLGAVAALALDDGPTPRPSPVSTTSATGAIAPPEPDWLPGGGDRFEATVLTAGPLDVADGVARLDYELATIGQLPYGDTYLSLPSPLPETWRLTTADGTTVEATTGPPRLSQVAATVTGSVRFDVPAATGPADVATIEVTGWRFGVPVAMDVTLEAVAGASFEMFDGTVVILARLLEQRDTTILDFDVTTPLDPWQRWGQSTQGPVGDFRPAGAGWATAGVTTGNGFQFTWGAPAAPENVTIDVVTTAWVPVVAADPLVVSLER